MVDMIFSILSTTDVWPNAGGTNATTDGLTHEKPKKGSNGNFGYSTILYTEDEDKKKIA